MISKNLFRPRKTVISCALAFLYALMIVFGNMLDTGRGIAFSGSLLLEFFFLVIASFIVVFMLFTALDFMRDKTGSSKSVPLEKKESRKRFFLYALILLILYIPIWLAGYPGFFCYDQSGIYEGFKEGVISAKHSPLIYFIIGLVIDFFYKLTGSFNVGIAVYIFAQMMVVSLCHSYLIVFIDRRMRPKFWIQVLLIAWYGLFPVFSMFAACSAKDVLFYSFAEVMVVKVYKMVDRSDVFFKGKLGILSFFLISTCMLLFRRNGIYSFVVAIPWIVLLMKKGFRLKASALLIVVVIVNIGVVSFVYPAVNVKKDNGKDALCIPIQQIARVYNYNSDSLDESDIAYIESLYTEKGLASYCDVSADNAKLDFKMKKVKKDTAGFVKFWVKLGMTHPVTYLEAFLLTNMYAWYPYSVIDGYQRLGDDYGWGFDYSTTEKSYFACWVEGPGEHDSKLPFLYDKLWYISRYISFEQIPVVRMLFSIGFWFWMLLFSISYLIYRKERAKLAAIMYPLLTVFVMLLGPMVLVRYYLILFYLGGYYIFCLFEGQNAS